MFKLPEPKDYFSRTVKFSIPLDNGKSTKASLGIKYKYLSQKELNDLTANNEDFVSNDNNVFLRNIIAGFEDVQIGERVLTDNKEEDWDYLFLECPYSFHIKSAIIKEFYNTLKGDGELTKRGN